MDTTSTITVVVVLLVGLGIGVGLGWGACAGRAASHAAAAQAELRAAREGHELLQRSLEAASEDAARRQSGAIGTQVAHIVGPLHDTLDSLNEQLRRTEHDRVAAYSGLTEQISQMRLTSSRLNSQTSRLASALRTPHIRGRWGEMHLRRVVELAGLTEHCDFSAQPHRRSGEESATDAVRPDLVVHLAGGGSMVIDAKVPLNAYLDSVDDDELTDKERTQLFVDHARALRAHVTALSAKKYWTAFDPSPEMVVLFVPADTIVEAAVRADPELLEYGFTRNIVIATPSSLMTLLRTVALSWRHDALTREADTILRLGRELHRRIGGVVGHLDRLGTSLNKSVESFNTTVGAVETRVAVTARKLDELASFAGGGELTPEQPAYLDGHARTVDSARFGAPH